MKSLSQVYCLTSLLVASFDQGHAFTAIPSAVSRFSNKNSILRNNDQSSLHALLDPMLLSVATDPSSPAIQQAFSAATFFPQPFWLLLVFIPKSDLTKKIMGGLELVTLCCLIHFFIVSASIVQPGGTAPLEEFSGVFDPAGNPQEAFLGMMQYPNFVSEEWSHVLTWDLFVGRWIWLDGLKRNIFTSHSVLLCNLIGPPGLLLHWATCLVTGKGLVENEAEDL
jgi:hypothetical protein